MAFESVDLLPHNHLLNLHYHLHNLGAKAVPKYTILR